MQVDLKARNAKIAALHAIKRHQGLSDDVYRDKLERITGKRSAKDLTDAELVKALDGFHGKQNQNRTYTAKPKALWIAAYNLGELEDGTDAALDSFVERQTGKPRLSFLTAAEANSVTEALKAICGRAGFIPDGEPDHVRRQLLESQWARLEQLGQVRIGAFDALCNYVSKKYLSCTGSPLNLDRQQLDDCARHFGRWIRKAQAKKRKAS